MDNSFNKDLQDILIFLGLENIGKDFKALLLQVGINNEDIKAVEKYGPHIFWYFGLDEFVKGKKIYQSWEFNYLAMSCLRVAIIEVSKKDPDLAHKMRDFINYQTIKLAIDIQSDIQKTIGIDLIKSLYEKLTRVSIKTSNKELYIIAGANGSGKSTLAQKIISNKKLNGENIIFINADEIAREIDPHNIDKVKIKAGKETLKRAVSVLESGQSFILESTMSGKIKDSKYSLLTIIKKAKEYGYKINLLYIYLDNPILCQERIKVRVSKGGHNVPDEDVLRRYSRSIKNFFAYKDILQNWVLYANSTNDFTEVAKSINGTVEILDQKIYNDIKQVNNL